MSGFLKHAFLGVCEVYQESENSPSKLAVSGLKMQLSAGVPTEHTRNLGLVSSTCVTLV